MKRNMAARKNKETKGNSEAAELCKKLGVERLYVNSKGEYFTERTYAIASEGGDRTKVSHYDANATDGEDEGKGESDNKEENE